LSKKGGAMKFWELCCLPGKTLEQTIEKVFKDNPGCTVCLAADKIGVSEKALWRKMVALGIERPKPGRRSVHLKKLAGVTTIGRTNRAIAREIGCSEQLIGKYRQRGAIK